jgi:hypothetical protein
MNIYKPIQNIYNFFVYIFKAYEGGFSGLHIHILIHSLKYMALKRL